MNFKIDTKEKFTIITPLQMDLYDNLTEELYQLATGCLQKPVKNVIFNFQNLQNINEAAAEKLTVLQQTFYENNASFVICQVPKSVEEQLDNFQLLETMNITPSESEAWDIVQMEEIERELLKDFDEE